ncbi:long-chain fatty acid transporter [Algoriphagus sp. CAU 1675]|uniref:OmpP1/FadL family transporter n=1 Tax=Algoriphagus sp. CAU 1675 TaxID=3032597 RepID=UPI0023DCA009|nr:long-chain fatty acid transporter [Algoriphagus sp. CAU 1675]MDF2158452.1 long-chain fatty acid transporter [Algoriphagus sp. CAU 1675]
MRLSYLFGAALCILSFSVNAQSGYFEDALRFSQTVPAGSARIMALGGTQWSLGGDVSNIAGNPAGLGFFRTSEASITLGYTDWKSDTRFMGQLRNYATTDFAIPNLSVVFASPKSEFERGSFKGGSFGISIQRIANFNNEFGFFSDQMGESSIIDFFLQDSDGIPESEIESYGLTGLGYLTYLINPIIYDQGGNVISNPNTYDSFVLGFPFQDENVTQEGSASQITFSYGGNFEHKLFVGGSLGIRSISYNSFKIYQEEFVNEPLASLSLSENLFINGSGVNLSLGVIYKPIDYVNLGFNFQTPTWYSLNDEYEAKISANYNNYYFEQEDVTLGREEAVTDIFLSTYGLNSPLKIGGGATFFVGKKGFISADLDWVDYSTARINSNDFDEEPDNQAIRNLYTSTVNFRLGAEARINDFRLRGGYAYFGDPYMDSNFDRTTQQLSGGVGLKLNNLSLDFTLVNQTFNSIYRSYQVLDSQNNNYGPMTEIENSIFKGVLTLGINF